MTTSTATKPIPTPLAADIANIHIRLKHARDDNNPNHNPQTCEGCYACVLEHQLNRLLDKLPR